ncbi:DNA-binding transcription factor, partial [Elasticomyces elasticus]
NAADFGPPQPMMQQQQQQQLDMFLPAALLQQFPALAGLDWAQMGQGPVDDVDEVYSGRSSFDAAAGSGGEWMDEYSENEMGDFEQGGHDDMGMGMGMGMGSLGMSGNGNGGGGGAAAAGGYNGNEYLSDFDGR